MSEFRPNFPQLRDGGNGGFTNALNGNGPVMVFFVHLPTIDDKTSELHSLVEKLLMQYGAKLRFFWVNSSEDENICHRMSLNGVPAIILFNQGKEVARFSCTSSEPGIRYNIDELLNPEKDSGLRYIRRSVPVA